MSLWLDHEELTFLTRYKTNKRRCVALAEMRIPFRVRPADGLPLVERAFFQAGVKAPTKNRINWEAA